MSKLDITIYDLFGEKNDSGYVLVDAKKTNEYINLAKNLEVEHEALKLKSQKEHELLELKNKMINAYQAYLASEHTHDRLMIDRWKSEIFRLQNEIYIKEKKLTKGVAK